MTHLPFTAAPGARVLVTGSQGFVGRHVRAALEARGCVVVGVDRPGTEAEHCVDLGDPRFDAQALADRVGALDAVLYLAATISRGSSVNAEARTNVRVLASAPVQLAEALATRPAQPHFVYCSTFKTYGPTTTLIDPERPPQRPDPWSYGAAKSLAERLLAVAAVRAGFRYAVVRPTCIYGPGQHLHNAIPIFLRATLEGRAPTVFGEGRNVRDDVFVADLAWLLIEAGLRRADGPFHAAGERARTVLEVAQLCCEVTGQALAPVLEPGKPPKWWLDQTFDLERSRSVLGYEPTSLRAGLEAEAAWLRAGAAAADAVNFASVAGAR